MPTPFCVGMIGRSSRARMLRETADAREGLGAFLEKRNPRWTTE